MLVLEYELLVLLLSYNCDDAENAAGFFRFRLIHMERGVSSQSLGRALQLALLGIALASLYFPVVCRTVAIIYISCFHSVGYF